MSAAVMSCGKHFGDAPPRSAVGAPASARASVPRVVIRTGARVTGGVVGAPTLLNDRRANLVVGEKGLGPHGAGRGDERGQPQPNGSCAMDAGHGERV